MGSVHPLGTSASVVRLVEASEENSFVAKGIFAFAASPVSIEHDLRRMAQMGVVGAHWGDEVALCAMGAAGVSSLHD